MNSFKAIEAFAHNPTVKTFVNEVGVVMFVTKMTYSSILQEVVCEDGFGNMFLLSELLKKGFKQIEMVTETLTPQETALE